MYSALTCHLCVVLLVVNLTVCCWVECFACQVMQGEREMRSLSWPHEDIVEILKRRYNLKVQDTVASYPMISLLCQSSLLQSSVC